MRYKLSESKEEGEQKDLMKEGMINKENMKENELEFKPVYTRR